MDIPLIIASILSTLAVTAMATVFYRLFSQIVRQMETERQETMNTVISI